MNDKEDVVYIHTQWNLGHNKERLQDGETTESVNSKRKKWQSGSKISHESKMDPVL